jgi:hypothetical protein
MSSPPWIIQATGPFQRFGCRRLPASRIRLKRPRRSRSADTLSGNAEMLRAIEQKREAVEAGRLRLEFPEALPRKLSPTRRALPLDRRSLVMGGGAGSKARLPRMGILPTPSRQRHGRSDLMNAISALVPVSPAHGSSAEGSAEGMEGCHEMGSRTIESLRHPFLGRVPPQVWQSRSFQDTCGLQRIPAAGPCRVAPLQEGQNSQSAYAFAS